MHHKWYQPKHDLAYHDWRRRCDQISRIISSFFWVFHWLSEPNLKLAIHQSNKHPKCNQLLTLSIIFLFANVNFD